MGTHTFNAVNSLTSAARISGDVRGPHSLESIFIRFFKWSYAFNERVDFSVSLKGSRLLSSIFLNISFLSLGRSSFVGGGNVSIKK